MSGELIGINSAKLSDTDVEGMGYAIAISDVKDSINTMLQGKDVSKSSTQSSSYYNNDEDDHSSPFEFLELKQGLDSNVIKLRNGIFEGNTKNCAPHFFCRKFEIFLLTYRLKCVAYYHF